MSFPFAGNISNRSKAKELLENTDCLGGYTKISFLGEDKKKEGARPPPTPKVDHSHQQIEPEEDLDQTQRSQGKKKGHHRI